MTLAETRDMHKKQAIAVKEVKLRELSKELEEQKDMHIKMEDKIYVLSIENK